MGWYFWCGVLFITLTLVFTNPIFLFVYLFGALAIELIRGEWKI